MNRSFTATCFHAEDMGDFLLVGLAEFDEQDLDLGMDDVHVERNDQGFSGYGGMRSVDLFPDRLHIDFDEIGMEFMDGLASTEVLFDFPAEVVEALRSALEQCFAGFACFHDHTRNA